MGLGGLLQGCVVGECVCVLHDPSLLFSSSP